MCYGVLPWRVACSCKATHHHLARPKGCVTVMYLFCPHRPVTTASGRHVRLGTTSMLAEPDGPFIDVSKLNIEKYAKKSDVSKVRIL